MHVLVLVHVLVLGSDELDRLPSPDHLRLHPSTRLGWRTGASLRLARWSASRMPHRTLVYEHVHVHVYVYGHDS